MKVLILFLTTLTLASCYTSIVLWHGFANAYTVESINEVKMNLEADFPGIHIKVLQIGDTAVRDFVNSIMMHPDKQIDIACKSVRSDIKLQKGYIGIGFSQGGLLLRGLAQRCSYPQMKKMITMGSMHQGIYGIPMCNVTYSICDMIRRIYSMFVYSQFVQNNFVQATYWHNPLNQEAYKKYNTFLTDINNENYINQTYIKNLNALEKFVMVKYTNERFVVPPDSEWFGFYKKNNSDITESLQQSQTFVKDRLGLRQMYKTGKLDFLTVPWNHVEFHWNWFKENIVNKYIV
ncbi:hypothetical protein FQA39_LY18227 [Lamprigera yunnana]|nr:hypothetical protein FQA39_LY18227 [Lamprigera yunnana]